MKKKRKLKKRKRNKSNIFEKQIIANKNNSNKETRKTKHMEDTEKRHPIAKQVETTSEEQKQRRQLKETAPAQIET